MPEHHIFSINLDDNFQNIVLDGEKTRVYSMLVCMGRNLFIVRLLWESCIEHEGRLPRYKH